MFGFKAYKHIGKTVAAKAVKAEAETSSQNPHFIRYSATHDERKAVKSAAANQLSADYNIGFFSGHGRAQYFIPDSVDTMHHEDCYTMAALHHAHKILDLPVVQDAADTASPVFILSQDGTLDLGARPVLVFRVDVAADHPAVEWLATSWTPMGPRVDEGILESILEERRAAFLQDFRASGFMDALDGYNHLYDWYAAKDMICTEKMAEIALEGIDVEEYFAPSETEYGYERNINPGLGKAIRANLRRYAMQDRYARKLAWRENWCSLFDIKLTESTISEPVMQAASGSDFMTMVDVAATLAPVQTAKIHAFKAVEAPKRPEPDAIEQLQALMVAKGLSVEDVQIIINGAKAFLSQKAPEAPKPATAAKAARIHRLPASNQPAGQANKKADLPAEKVEASAEKEQRQEVVEQITPKKAMGETWAKLLEAGWKPIGAALLKKRYGRGDYRNDTFVSFFDARNAQNELRLHDRYGNFICFDLIQDYAGIVEKIEKNAHFFWESRKKALEEKAAATQVKVGDIFVSTWGYEQTNVNFYQVVKATAKTVTVREIRRSTEPGGAWGHYTAMPVKDAYCGEPMRRKIGHDSDRPSISISSFAYARLWDGKPIGGTSYA